MLLKELQEQFKTAYSKGIFEKSIENDTELNNVFNDLLTKKEIPIDEYMECFHGKRTLFECFVDFNKDIIIAYIKAMLHSNIYKYTELARSMITDYNPIENYDRTEERTEAFTKDIDSTLMSGEKTSDTINKVTPNTSNDLVTESGTEYRQNAFTDTTGQNESGNTNIQSRVHGNVGVTTTQEMLLSTRDVAMFNITSIIAKDIVNMLCVGVYDYD